MSLFEIISPNTFSVLSGPSQRLFSKVITELYKVFYDGIQRHPSDIEIQQQIWKILVTNQTLWTDEELSDIDLVLPSQSRRRRTRSREVSDKSVDLVRTGRKRLSYVYNTLVRTEWLELIPSGRYYHCDMRPVHKRLARFLVQIENGFETQLAGIMTQIRSSLQAVARSDDPRDEAAGLLHARETFKSFIADLATLDGVVRDIEKQIFAEPDPSKRIMSFAEEFVEKLLLKDFKAIQSTHHPFKQKDKTLRLIIDLLSAPDHCDMIADGLMRDNDKLTRQDARAQVYKCLEDIQSGFEVISDYLESIKKKQRSIERRIRSTFKFVFSGRRNILASLQSQLKQVHSLPEHTEVPAAYYSKDRVLSPLLLVEPRGRRVRRSPVKVQRTAEPPELIYRRQLTDFHSELMLVTPKSIKEFLFKQGFEFVAKRLSEADTHSLHDFLIADAIRTSLMKGVRKNNPFATIILKNHKVAPCKDAWVCSWASGPDFKLIPRNQNAA